MRKIFTLFTSIVLIVFISNGCGKEKGCTDPMSIEFDEDAEANDNSCVYAGSGGSALIVAYAKHHGVPIVGTDTLPDSVFVKFNAKDSPGLDKSLYDLAIAGEEGEDHVHIPNLKRGYYWIMMTGYDAAAQERVFGGSAAIISGNNDQINLEVAVSED